MPYHYMQTQRDFTITLHKIEGAIYTPLAELHTEAWITPEPVPFVERQSGTHKVLGSGSGSEAKMVSARASSLLASGPGDPPGLSHDQVLSIGQSWGKLWDCAWFHFTGIVPEAVAGKAVVLLIDLSGEACVVDNDGSPILGLTTVNSEFDRSLGGPGKRIVPLAQSAKSGEVVDLWADAGCNDLFGVYRDSGTLKSAHIALYNEEMFQLYHDFEVLWELMSKLSQEKARYHRILSALYGAANELVEYTTEEAQRARALLSSELAKAGGTPSLKISAIGHAHIDLGWLWPIRETIRKGARTFSTVLAMMDRYPDYVFGASQPQLYQWMKDHYPQLYKKIQAKVAEGRWETQGAMWVEPDTNISGGEALVRQIIYGKRFFREEFGKDPKMLWLPDVFGYSAALPQILKKAGVDYFLTIKLSWNSINVFPHHTFFWQGIDGSRVLAHMPPEGTYNSSAAPRAIIAAEKNFADKAVSEHCALLFGIGDGGGGPGTEHLERLAREKNLEGLVPVTQEHMETFFDRISQDTTGYQTWTGELYLERHQGTYTTQGRNKRFNRKMELALRELEFAATLAGVLVGHTYPTQELDAIWKEILLYQFHDILPGSSITRVYDESLARYQQLFEQTQQLLSQAQAALIPQPDAAQNSQSITVFNSLSWERCEWLRIHDQWHYVAAPSLGYTTLNLATHLHEDEALKGLIASTDVLENDKLRVSFAPDGTIQAIFDKEHQREVLAPDAAANRLAVYHDEPYEFDAWEVSITYDKRPPQYFRLEKTEARINGPQAIVEQHYHFGQSTLQQCIVLTTGSRRIDFITTVDWQESHKMLRTSFPVAILATEVTCDIQFGWIKRPTHRNTSWDMARYEICAQKWIDLSQWDYGVALLNDCKYGHKVSENILDLNLLRSPSYPDPQADRAQHEFTYALYPHTGNHIVGGVVRAGYELNVPLRSVLGTPQQSHHPSSLSLAHIEAENVIIETVKKAEKSDDIILRLYEASGATTRTTLTFDREINTVWRTNLLEEPEQSLDHQQKSVKLTLSPFEILTLRVQF